MPDNQFVANGGCNPRGMRSPFFVSNKRPRRREQPTTETDRQPDRTRLRLVVTSTIRASGHHGMDETFQVIERALSLVDKYGVGLTIVTLIIIGAVKYGPGLINAHRSFLATSEETQRRLTTSVEAQTASFQTHHANAEQHYAATKGQQEVARRCGQHFCDVLEHVAEKLDIQDRIDDSVSAIRRELAGAKVESTRPLRRQA